MQAHFPTPTPPPAAATYPTPETSSVLECLADPQEWTLGGGGGERKGQVSVNATSEATHFTWI